MQSYLAENFERYWLEVLEGERTSLACSTPSLYVDLNQLKELLSKILAEEMLQGITILGLSNVCWLILQMVMHVMMMLRWHRENPLTEKKSTRSIKVGLPLDY